MSDKIDNYCTGRYRAAGFRSEKARKLLIQAQDNRDIGIILRELADSVVLHSGENSPVSLLSGMYALLHRSGEETRPIPVAQANESVVNVGQASDSIGDSVVNIGQASLEVPKDNGGKFELELDENIGNFNLDGMFSTNT
jgi:hypothetical protein